MADDVVFLHRLVPGPASRSYGVAVAKLAGLPESVLARARAMLQSLESDGTPLRASSHGPKDQEEQLHLFATRPRENRAEADALETLRALDVDRLTGIEALALLARLKDKL